MRDHEGDIEEILITKDELKKRIKSIANEIETDYSDRTPLLVSVLKGGVVFLTELMMEIKAPLNLDFLAISSYGASTQETGAVKLIKDLDESIEDRDIILVEDIIDTGLTLNYLISSLKARKPASLKVCTLLDKSVRRIVDIPIDYKGFDVGDLFLVGFGLDYRQRYRNLPYVGVLKKEVYFG
ncbi:MAG: hypoxanthine phosphoribosyltransferase [Actinomycetota bacterium]|nr:hypoxanthine phosphoribosyltransferase [Actinomycetota bacterium]